MERSLVPKSEAILKDARDQLTMVLGFFPRVDAKLSTILAIDTAMLAAMSASVPALGSLSMLIGIAPLLATGLLVASYIYLYRGGFPNVKGGHASLIYFKEIAKRTESKFIQEYEEATPHSLSVDVLGQVWRNSEILTEKFRCLRMAFILMALSSLPWAISLGIFAMNRGSSLATAVRP